MHLMNGFLEVSSIFFQGVSTVRRLLRTALCINTGSYGHTTICHYILVETLLEKLLKSVKVRLHGPHLVETRRSVWITLMGTKVDY